MLRWILGAIAAVVVLVVAGATVAVVHIHARQHQILGEAQATADAMIQQFYDPSIGLLANDQGHTGQATSPNSLFTSLPFDATAMWGYSWALDALEQMAALPGGSQYLPRVKTLVRNLSLYWDTKAPVPGYAPMPNPGGGANKFYDDNAWAGLDLVYAYRLTGNAADLGQAEAVFRYEETGWDTQGGGIYWNDQHQGRNTAANAPTSELASYLYIETHQATYLQWAEKIYNWEVQTLVNPITGEVYDGVSGSLAHAFFTYNQGDVIGAATLLYTITHNQSYLNQAKKTFGYLASQGVQSNGVLVPQAEFNGVLSDNLVLLYKADADPAIINLLDTNAKAAWNDARNPKTGMIAANWNGPAPTAALQLLDETGAVRMFAADTALHGIGPTVTRWLHRQKPCPEVTSLFQAVTANCVS